MSGSKHFDKIAWVVTALTLVITILFMNSAALGMEAITKYTMGYESRLFDNTRVHTIDIVMNDWDELITNAASEEYYNANVVIDNESYKNVGIRAKGNTSLSTVASLGSERYSFKIEFDHYDSSKTYYGLDKLSLNNLIQDSTMMKDYLTYTMMNRFGVNSSLCSYVYITVNGEDWGLYLAVEGVEEAFLERNYGSSFGELYKPDSMSFGGGRGNGMDFNMDDFDFSFGESSSDSSESGNAAGSFDPSAIFGGNMPNIPSFEGGEMPDNFDPSNIPENFDLSAIPDKNDNDGENSGFGFGDGFGMGSSDVKLQYIDDEIDSYSNIWDNAKTDISKADKKRLINSLKKLSNNEDIESVVDVEQVIRYFVVHNYVCNDDSYTGMMVHNYYLYEKAGQLAMIPWDYNLAFGTFGGGNATSTVNTPIDSPVSGGSSDRPMLNWIYENEEYTELYHQYFAEFLNSIDIQEIIDSTYDLIKSYVEKDPTAFYSYDEFETGVKTLRQFCEMRSESITMQLDNGNTTDNMSYVDASNITLSDMGSMNNNTGGFGGNAPSAQNGMADSNTIKPTDSQLAQNAENSDNTADTNDTSAASSGAVPNNAQNNTHEGFTGEMPDGFTPPDMPEGFDASDFSGNVAPSDIPENFNQSNMPAGLSDNSSGQSADNQKNDNSSDTSDSTNKPNADRPSGENMNRANGDFTAINGAGAISSNFTEWLLLAASIVILAVGLVIAKIFKD